MTEMSVPPFSAFAGPKLLASGPLAEVAIAIKIATGAIADPIVIFDNATGKSLDIDLRGSHREVVARLPQPSAVEPATEASDRAPWPWPAEAWRCRPRGNAVAAPLGVAWRPPGGASVALRKLVEEARRVHGDRDRLRAARDAAYHFMSTMAGDRPGFEEASRALFADDRRRFAGLIAPWPEDIRDHVIKLAFSDRAESTSA
jgi:hypothetical protein